MLSKDHYVKTVEQLKTLENPMVPRTPSDHNLLRWGGLLRVSIVIKWWKSLLSQGQNQFEPLPNVKRITSFAISGIKRLVKCNSTTNE